MGRALVACQLVGLGDEVANGVDAGVAGAGVQLLL